MRSIFCVPSTSTVNASARLPLRSMPEDARALTISTSLTFEVDIATAARKPKKQCLRSGEDQTSPLADVRQVGTRGRRDRMNGGVPAIGTRPAWAGDVTSPERSPHGDLILS